jgi:hypothetical protein
MAHEHGAATQWCRESLVDSTYHSDVSSSYARDDCNLRDGRTGRAVTRDLADYHVPVNADVPGIDIIMVDEDDRT